MRENKLQTRVSDSKRMEKSISQTLDSKKKSENTFFRNINTEMKNPSHIINIETKKSLILESGNICISGDNRNTFQKNQTSSFPTEQSPLSGGKGISIEKICEFLWENEGEMKLNFELRNIFMKEDLLYVNKMFSKEVEKNISRMPSFENSDQNEYDKNIKEITNKTIVDILQDLVDQGKIQHAFIIYSLFKYSIQVPDKILRHWSHGYLGKIRKRNNTYL